MRNKLAIQILLPILMLLSSSGAWAQSRPDGPRYEFGGGVVGSFYDKKTFTSTSGSADGGFAPGYGASVWVGNQMYPKISGEMRYDYLRNDMTLEGSGGKATFGGDSHAVHYDLHFHFRDTSSKIRPFIMVGGGVKVFRGIGEERAYQPLSQIAVLTQTSQITGLVTFGFGVKMKLSNRALLRLEFRDNMSQFPTKLIAPNRSTGGDGWTNNFAPTVGLSVLY